MDRQKPKNDSKRDNPFSFRNFLTSSAPNDNTSRPITSHINHTQPETTSHNRSANPYSFARFIQNTQPRPTNTIRGDNTILVQGELPDFVQDHVPTNGINSDEYVSNPSGLPDFTLHISENNEILNEVQSTETLTFSDSLLNETSLRTTNSNSTNLPDFLSGTGLNILSDNSIDTESLSRSNHIRENGHHIGSNDLTGDGINLSSQIEELQEEVRLKNLRILQLENELLERDKKEDEETEIMEGVMREVNENLSRAIERWHSSEAEVERLKCRIRQLEYQLQLKPDVNKGYAPMHIVRDLGRQMGSDLLVADSVLRNLQEHSDRLKLMAGHLQYLDRVTEENGTARPSSPPSPPSSQPANQNGNDVTNQNDLLPNAAASAPDSTNN